MFRKALLTGLLFPLFVLASVVKVGDAPADPGGIPHVPDEVIIKFKANASQHDKDEVLGDLGGDKIKGLGRIHAELRRLGSGLTVDEAIGRYRNHPKVEYIEPNYILEADEVPDDPQFPQMWGLRNTGQTGGTPGADINAVSAWDITTGSSQVLIGVIDTGVDYTHPDLAANIWTNPGEVAGNGIDDDGNGFVDDVRGWDFSNNDNDPMDDNGHGTHTSGTIGAVGDNGTGVTGVNWNVMILPIKFLSSSGSGSTANAIEAVNYATMMGVTLTSNSWGGGGYSQALQDAIQEAGDAGILFVAAAGNTGADSDIYPHYPASYPLDNIVSVAATDHNDQLAGFSTRGVVTVDLAAPGVNVLSTIPGGAYGQASGTSMACPHVAGVLGLVYARFPGISHLDAKDLVLNAADPLPALDGQVLTGARLNAFWALAEPDSIPPGPVTDLAVTTPGSNWLVLSWTAPGDDNNDGTASRYVVKVSGSPIDENTFAAAQTAPAPPDPGPAGTPETMKVTGLAVTTSYYLAVKAYDEFGSASPISNLVSGTTLGAPQAGVAPGDLSETLVTGTTGSQELILSNLAQGTLDFVIPTPNLITGSPVVAEFLELAKGADDPRTGSPVTEGTGGPDAFGYRWTDSDEAYGPVFEWTDISTTGTLAIFDADDVNDGPYPIGFPFSFYGAEFTDVRICSNGFLSFTSPSAEYVNQPLPNPGAPLNMIAPFWDDLVVYSGGRIYYLNDGARFIVQWEAEHYNGGGPYTFQAILYPDGAIEFQYLAMGIPSDEATVGIQNATASDALQIAFNAAYAHDSLAVRIQSVPQWLTVVPSEGTVDAGESATLEVTFDPSGLTGGTYAAVIDILCNDPGNPTLPVPVSLTVVGAPDITVTPDSYDFGPVFLGGAPGTTIQVGNPGTDTLKVTGVSIDNPVFSTTASGFVVPPNRAVPVTVTFSPTTTGLQNAVLTLASNDPDSPTIGVSLAGEGIEPPDIAVSPDSLVADLFTGNTATEILTVQNDGASDLVLDVEIQDSQPAPIPVYAPPPPPNPDLDSVTGSSQIPEPDLVAASQDNPSILIIQDTLAWGLSMSAFLAQNFGLTATVIPSSALAATDLSLYDLVITVGDEGPAYYGALSANADRFTAYVEAGGIVQYQLATQGDDVDIAGGALVRYGNAEDTNRVLLPGHPIVQGLPADLPGNRANHCTIVDLPAGAQVITETSTSHLPTTAEYAMGGGHVVVTGMTWEFLYLHGYTSGPLILNATAYSLGLIGPTWLTPDLEQATVSPGSSLDLGLTFDASGLLGGRYDADVVILSNDPDQPEVRIPARLQVTGAPDLALSAPSLDFGSVYVLGSADRMIQVSNTGTDLLQVAGVSADDTDYSVSAASFSLAPGESRTLTVRFAPTTAEPHPATLTLASNDPDTPVATVALSGLGLVPPDISVSPASMTESLLAGESTTRILGIRNTGLSDLVLSLEISENVAPPPPYSPSGTPDPDLDSRTGGSEEPAVPQSPASQNDPRILVIQETTAWGLSMSTFLQQNFGIDPTVIPSWQIASTDFADFDVVITVGDEGSSYYNALSANVAKFTSFVQGGGVVQYQAATQGSNVALAGGASAVFGDLEELNDVVLPGHPIVQGLPAELPGTNANHCTLTDLPPGAQVITESSAAHLPTTVEYSLGLGRVIATGMTWEFLYVHGFSSGPLVLNATAYSLSLIRPAWLVPDVTEATIPAGDSLDVTMTFSAAGLVGGGYDAAILVLSNDPDEPRVAVPAHLDVTGVPDIQLADSALDFGTLYVGDLVEKDLTVLNGGTDVLTVTAVGTDLPDYAVDTSAFSLAPGGTRVLTVGYSPTTAGAAPATLSLSSNDPDTPVAQVALSGQGVEPPVASVDPTEIVADLSLNQAETRPVSLENSGGSGLEYRVDFVATSPSPTTPPPPPPGPKIALHTKAHVTKGILTCVRAQDGGASPTDIPCSEYVTQGRIGVGYDVYVAVGDVTDQQGIASMLFGISYDGAPLSGVDIFSWNLCADGLEFPSATWPASGSGNMLTWILPSGCQDTELPPNGAHAVGGAFYVYAYSEDVLRITPHYAIGNPRIAYSTCNLQEVTIPSTAAGTVRFTPDGSTPGLNPCAGGVTVYDDPTVQAEGQEDLRTGYPVTQGFGGPDEFGYRWVDSDEADGPSFQWVDIGATGTPVAISGDNQVSAPLPIGFEFPFYGETYTEFRVGTNGYITFISSTPYYYNYPLPSPYAPRGLLAAFWDDLNVSPGQVVFAGDEDRLVVQFQGIYHDYGYGPYTFQIILDRNGTILYQYQSLDGYLISSTVGIQNADATDGLTVAFNTPYLHDGLAVRLRPVPSWASVDPVSGVVPPLGAVPLNVTLDATSLLGATTYLADMLIQSNDPATPLLTVPVTLNVSPAPYLTLTPSALHFGGTYLGYGKSMILTAGNSGNQVLSIPSVAAGRPDYTVDASSFNLDPGETRQLTVTFQPAATGTRNTELVFTGNDPRGPLTVALTGNGLIPPEASVEPTDITSDLYTNQQDTRLLSLENTGGGELDYTVDYIAISGPPTPPPPPLPGPKIAVHVQIPPTKAAFICRRAEDGGAAPTNIPCSEYVNRGLTGVGYNVYVAVGNVTDQNGIAGMTFGVAYNGAPSQGVDVINWNFCASGLEFPSDNWPASGSGNIVTWLLPDDCQDTEVPPNGAHAVAGAFYVYAYSEDLLRITPHYELLAGPQLEYANCNGLVSDIPETAAGSARFTPGGTTPGFNPCQTAVAVDEDPTVRAKGEEDPRPGFPVADGFGGPDGFGYRWVDSNRPEGPVFDWVDVRNVGDLVPLSGDDAISGTIPIGFQFPFYGNHYSSFRICTNGYLSFTSEAVEYLNRPLPSIYAPGNLLAPFWDDLDMATPRIYTYTDGTRMVVQFQELYSALGYGPYTFEIILDPSGTILYQYLAVTAGPVTSATVGIQNGTGDDGLTVAYNNAYPANRLAVRFRPQPDWLSVAPRFGRVYPQGNASIQVDLDATRLAGATYLADILVESNDPERPRISIPVTLNVTPAPDLVLSAGSLDYGQIFVGYSRTLNLDVRNDGNEVLSVSSISAGLPDYSADPPTFDLAPGNVQILEVTFRPGTDGDRSTLLTLSSNDPESPHTVDLNGSGLYPPVITAAPDTVVGASLPGGTKSKTLTVGNTGGSDLNFQVASYVEPPPPPPQPGPKVALHVQAHTTKGTLICRRAQDGGAEPTTIPCSQYTTRAPTGIGRDIYLVAAGVDSLGLSGLSCGIAYDGTPGSGVDVVGSWYFCASGLQFPSDDWPGDGSGNRMTWLIPEDCQRTVISPDGVHAVAGAFYVYAYGSDVFRVTENRTLQTPPELVYTDCHGATRDIPVTAVGSVRFSPGGTADGYNPCAGGTTVYPGLDLTKETEDTRTGYPVIDDQGGPDGFGYRWVDSDAEYGPVFDWVDIRNLGTPVAIDGDDRTSNALPIGFAFPFYGNTYGQFRVCTNGWISFTSGSIQFLNQPLPAQLAPENLLAVLWDDLTFPGQQAFTYNDGTRLIIQFQDVFRGTSGPYTFEIILRPDGTILYQYLDLQGPLNSATVGIQNAARDQGLTVAFNTAYLHEGLAVRLAAPAEWLGVDPASGTIPAGQSLDLGLTLNATWLEAGDYTTEIALDSNDPATPSLSRDVVFHVGSVDAAAFNADPNTLNLGSSGRWVTAYVELPLAYAPEDVLVGTVLLNGVVPADPDLGGLGDFNENGVPDLAFKFDRQDVESHLEEGDSVEVRVTGEIEDTIYFTGSEFIRAIRPSLKAPNGGEQLVAGTLVRIEWENPPAWEVTSAGLTYSADDGLTWSLIAEGVPPEGYTWTVPAEATETGRVRVAVYDDLGILGHDTSDEAFSVVSQVTGIEETLPTAYALMQNAPNPFSGSSRIRYDLPEPARVQLRIYDVSGRVMRTLADGWFPAGRQEAVWDGRDSGGRQAAAGIYFYRLEAGSFTAKRSLSLLR